MASKDYSAPPALAFFQPATCAGCCRAAERFSEHAIAVTSSNARARGTDVESVYQEAISNMKIVGIDALVVLGGEGTLTIAAEFHKHGIPVCGVPKTIDNDLACTELTFGFVTALDIATEALDRLHTTAESHDRVMILEVMGRHTGWIALHSGIAGGADVILIPEIPFSLEVVAEKIRARDAEWIKFQYHRRRGRGAGDRARA